MKTNEILGLLLLIMAYAYPFEAQHIIVGLVGLFILMFVGIYLFNPPRKD